MTDGPRTGHASPHRQVGAAALVFLVILVMGSLYAILTNINTATAEARRHQDEVTREALRQAMEALIARAATDENRPGSLPCPDLVTNVGGNVPNDGRADLFVGNDCPSYLGRLPWRTLGLPDLRDAAGERLWYALSPNFRDDASVQINSDTPGQLTIQGLAPATNVVAIVFAPGPSTLRTADGSPQNRSGAAVNDLNQYLEGENAGFTPNVFHALTRCERSDCPGPGAFNDQLIVITHENLMTAVEAVVAKRVESQIKPRIQAHFDAWRAINIFGDPVPWPPSPPAPATPTPNPRGFYPFATPFNDGTAGPSPPAPPADPTRDQSRYWGVAGLTNGLLPLSRDTAWMKWNASAPTQTGGTAAFQGAPTCAGNATRLRCDFVVAPDFGGLTARIAATVENVGNAFALPIDDATDPGSSFYTVSGLPFDNGVERRKGWITASPTGGVTEILYSRTLDSATGHLSVLFEVQVSALPFSTRQVTVRIPTPQRAAWTGTGDPETAWFINNRWYRYTYYAISPAYAPGGVGRCDEPSQPCILVENLAAPANDKRVVLVLAGRNLQAGARPWEIANYFELANAVGTPKLVADVPDFLFRRDQRSQAFNDRLVVVAP